MICGRIGGGEISIVAVTRKSPTLHDFPYDHPRRKCYHKWIINVAPPGEQNCLHRCLYCYARDAIYSRGRPGSMMYYTGLSKVVERELDRITLCPPVSLSNATDPCQPVPGLRAEVRELVGMLLSRGVSLSVITKGDPSFLYDLPGFAGNPRVFVAVTVEGMGEVLHLLSPLAPSLDSRLAVLREARHAGIRLIARLDPVFPPLWRAIYGSSWREVMVELLGLFADAGVGHIISSTGTLNLKSRKRVYEIIHSISRTEAESFVRDYLYEADYPSPGYRLRRGKRIAFHSWLRSRVEERGMSYASCIELESALSDTPGLPHCEAYPAPFCVKDSDGFFHPLEGCTANCHVSCLDREKVPCGRPQLAQPGPFKPAWLR